MLVSKMVRVVARRKCGEKKLIENAEKVVSVIRKIKKKALTR